MIYKIFFSATGRTEKTMNIVSDCFDGEKMEADLSATDFSGENFHITADDFCIFAVPVYGGRIPAPAKANFEKLKGNGAKMLLMAVFGNRAVDDCLLEMKDIAEAQGFVPVAAIEASVQHSIITKVAENRPDAQDRAQLEEFAEKVKELIGKDKQTFSLTVPGNRPYTDMGSMPLRPKADSRCTECGLCAERCPVQTIPKTNPRISEKDRCMLCMRCVEICPVHARDFNPVLMKAASVVAKPVFAGRKPNRLYTAE